MNKYKPTKDYLILSGINSTSLLDKALNDITMTALATDLSKINTIPEDNGERYRKIDHQSK